MQSVAPSNAGRVGVETMMRTLILLSLLAACEPTKTPATPSAEGEGEGEGETPTPALYDVAAGSNTAALTWRAGSPAFAGYSATGGEQRLYLADPLGDGLAAYVYGVPWTASGSADVEDAAEATLSVGLYGPDKLSFEAGLLGVPDADADVGEVPSAGIGYQLGEPVASGAVADLATLSISGDTETGYAARILRLDADLDGAADDALATQSTYDSEEVHGQLAVFLNVTERAYLWSEADAVVPACTDTEGSRIAYGPVDLAADVDGSHLWVACPASNYRSGVVELHALPLGGDTLVGGVEGVGGWTVAPDPRGGVWAGSQGGGVVLHIDTDLTPTSAYPYLYESDDSALFGASPAVVETSAGQVLLVVGTQSRTSEAAFAPPRGRFQPGTLDGAPAGDTASSAVYVCDVTTLPSTDASGFADLADCGRYTPPEGLGCVGGVQGVTEQGGAVYLFSAGWLYGSGASCGAGIWRLYPSGG